MDDIQVQRSIGFPLNVLKTVDDYAYQNGISRTEVVRVALKEYFKNHNISEKI